MTKSIALAKAFGSSIFCDDLRLEVGNKISLMGAYTNGLTVHAVFPVTLPKFCIWVSYSEKVGQTTGDLSIQVFMPGDSDDTPSARTDIPMDDVRALPLPDVLPDNPDGDLVRKMDIPIVFPSLVLKNTGYIKVRALLGDEKVKLGALRISQEIQQPQSEPSESRPEN